MEKEKGRQGGLAKPTMQLSESYPVRMKQIPLAMNTVRYVDQTQQILLSETETEEKEQTSSQNKRMDYSASLHPHYLLQPLARTADGQLMQQMKQLLLTEMSLNRTTCKHVEIKNKHKLLRSR